MQYLGGKFRIRKQLAGFMLNYCKERKIAFNVYLEPFCGACWVAQEMAIDFNFVTCSDINNDVILLWQHAQAGGKFPEYIDENEYESLRMAPPSWKRGLAGIGCSFGGKWFGGYARGGVGRNYVSNCTQSLVKAVKKLAHVKFVCMGYDRLNPQGSLVYCDPPYMGTTAYKGIESFNYPKFWETMRQWSQHNLVFISEFQAPPDFECVLAIPKNKDMRNAAGIMEPCVDKLFKYSKSRY